MSAERKRVLPEKGQKCGNDWRPTAMGKEVGVSPSYTSMGRMKVYKRL